VYPLDDRSAVRLALPKPPVPGAETNGVIMAFGIGEDSGQPVTFDYKLPFAFTGEIEKVVVDVK
jgi:hypothetical protein